jgi:hypothetical protein
LLLLQRNDAGTASNAYLEDLKWTSNGPWLVRPPAAALDARGRVVQVGITPDARLRVL